MVRLHKEVTLLEPPPHKPRTAEAERACFITAMGPHSAIRSHDRHVMMARTAKRFTRRFKPYVYLIQAKQRLMGDALCVKEGPAAGQCLPQESAERDHWTEGRNALIAEALRRAAEMQNGGYFYYVLTDDDAFPVPRDLGKF
eukprot:gene10039-58481_t